jgi:hypothetical protein
MKKNLLFILAIIVIVIILSGCGGGGASTGDNSTGNSGTAGQQQTISAAINSFAFDKAVGDFDVFEMMEYLSKDDDFQLTISEAGDSYKKTYDELKNELVSVTAQQSGWHTDHGYVLQLILGSPRNHSNVSNTGGIAFQSFIVIESASSPAIDKTITDSGYIMWEVIERSGKWVADAMTISYDSSINLRELTTNLSAESTVKSSKMAINSYTTQSNGIDRFRFFGHFNGSSL